MNRCLSCLLAFFAQMTTLRVPLLKDLPATLADETKDKDLVPILRSRCGGGFLIKHIRVYGMLHVILFCSHTVGHQTTKHPPMDMKGSRKGHFVKVSLWYASLLTNTKFCFLYFRISNC